MSGHDDIVRDVHEERVAVAEPLDELLDSGAAGGTAIRGTVLRAGSFAGGVALNLLAAPFMIRHLGPVDYGYFITVTSIVFIIGGITDAGLTNLGVRYYAAAHTDTSRGAVIGNLIGLRLVLTTAGIVLTTAVTAIAGAPAPVVSGIAVYGLGLLLTMISSTYSVPLSANLRLGTTSALDLLRQALFAAGTVALVVAGVALLGFFVLWVLVSAVLVFVTALIVRGTVSIRPVFDRLTWRDYLGHTLAYGIAAAAGIIYFRVAAALMTFLSTDLQTGYFAAPFRILEIGTVVPWLVVTSVFPILVRAARDDRARLGYAAQRIVEVGAIVSVGMALVLSAGADVFIRVLAGPGFEESIPVLRLEAITLVGTFVVASWSLILLSLHEERALLKINGVGVAAALVAAVILIPPFGAMGGAGVVVIAEGIVAVVSIVTLHRRHPDVSPHLAPLWRVAVAAGLGAATVLLPLAGLATLVLAGAVYVVAILALRAVPEELWPALRGVT